VGGDGGGPRDLTYFKRVAALSGELNFKRVAPLSRELRSRIAGPALPHWHIFSATATALR
jgi:hypothetical protein